MSGGQPSRYTSEENEYDDDSFEVDAGGRAEDDEEPGNGDDVDSDVDAGAIESQVPCRND